MLILGAKHLEDGGTMLMVVASRIVAFIGMYTSYAGSKAPVEHFTRGVAKELSSRRMSVYAVALGPIDTRKLVTCNSIVVTNAHSTFFYRQDSPEAVEFHRSTASFVQRIWTFTNPVCPQVWP